MSYLVGAKGQEDLMTDLETIQRVAREAAEAAAEKVLHRIGLGDDDSGHDVRELRDLLNAWRGTKAVFWNTVVKFGTTALLAALAAGSAVRFWRAGE